MAFRKSTEKRWMRRQHQIETYSTRRHIWCNAMWIIFLLGVGWKNRSEKCHVSHILSYVRFVFITSLLWSKWWKKRAVSTNTVLRAQSHQCFIFAAHIMITLNDRFRKFYSDNYTVQFVAQIKMYVTALAECAKLWLMK